MQLTAAPNFDSCEVPIAPLQEVDVCCRLQERHEPTSTTADPSTPSRVTADSTMHATSSSRLPLTLPLHYFHLTKTTHRGRTYNRNSDDGERVRPCPQQTQGGLKKRKYDDTGDDESLSTEKRQSTDLQLCRKLLLARKKILTSADKGENIPLFYLYGDLLLIPKFKWSNGDSVQSGRRRSQGEPAMNNTIDLNNSSEAAHMVRPRTPSLLHVEVVPDSQSLEAEGYDQMWFNRVMQLVIHDLNQFGLCVIDNFLGETRAEQIRAEVGDLHSRGVFHDGQVMARQDQARGRVRGDKITWVTGSEPNCAFIGQLVSVVDSLIAKCNTSPDAGTLAQYNIKWRTRAMVACYPGQGTHYVKHVDNPNGDGRCITAIYYINKDWRREDGGMLRIYPEGMKQVAEIEPLFDRMLFFWSDRRNPHEVMPASVTSRYAVTVWYLDQNERENYLARQSSASAST